MILAPLAEFGTYIPMNKLFEKVENALITMDFNSLGQKFEIEGDRLFVIPSFNKARSKSEAKLEAHNKYIDIQVCLQGEETIAWCDRNMCKLPLGEFDTDKDIIFYNDNPTNYITLKPRTFAIFYPNDCHAPLIGSGMIKKLVFKVALE